MMVSETTDLISRSALLEELREERDWFKDVGEKETAGVIALAMKRTRNAPAIDAVPVVRCRECEHRGSAYKCPMRKLVMPYNGPGVWEDCTEDEGFCSKGKKREGGGDAGGEGE